MAILCVGIAYFVIAVLFPLFMFLSQREQWPGITTTGLVFSGLAGVAGAVGALCVVFASKSAARIPGARLYIAPLIFGLAPVINTLVSTLWHPQPGNPFHFKAELPGWKLWVGIVLVGAGAALVLLSKEEAEQHKKAAVHPPAATAAVTPGGDSPSPVAP
jgi:drug/metabolite transporter (DMT)-like permease